MAWCWPPRWTARRCSRPSKATWRRARRSSSRSRRSPLPSENSAPMRASRLALALVAAATLGCPSRAPKIVVYALAERLAVAERWSARDVILFGTPAAEPHLASGFFREAGAPRGDRFTWAGREAELSVGFASP